MYTSDDDKKKLQLTQLSTLQGIIARMSNYILAIQTGTVTGLIGLLVYTKAPTSHTSWWFLLVPWFLFMMYHYYFLKLEHSFRYLYNEVIKTDVNNITLDILKIDEKKLKAALKEVSIQWRASLLKHPFRRPLLSFYVPLILLILFNQI